MKKLLFLITLLVGFSTANAHHIDNRENKLVITYAKYWAPYSYYDENGKIQGILIELLNELLHKRLNIELEHVGLPWKRAQVIVEDGIYDAVITSPTAKRKKLHAINEETLINIEWRIFVSKNSKKFFDVMDMNNPLKNKNFSYCSILGDDSSREIFKNYGIEGFHQSKDLHKSIEMLDSGRIDIFMNSKLTTLTKIYEKGLQDKIKLHPTAYKEMPFKLMISNKSSYNKKILKKLDTLVAKMKKDGSYYKLIEKIEEKVLKKVLIKQGMY